jgi:hypothetical protein
MKRIILTAVVMAFAVAAQAGDAKPAKNECPLKDKPACCAAKTSCSASKEKVSTGAKDGCCPFAKSAACNKKAAKRPVLASPKAADLAN